MSFSLVRRLRRRRALLSEYPDAGILGLASTPGGLCCLQMRDVLLRGVNVGAHHRIPMASVPELEGGRIA
jgi:hypothetical protein